MGNFATKRDVTLFVGCAIPSRRFENRMLREVKSKTCQCKLRDEATLLKTYRFCPKCGSKFVFQSVTRENGFDSHSGKLGDFVVLHDSKHYLVGKYVGGTTNTLAYNDVMAINDAVGNMKNVLMETLLDVALWEEDTYGLHFLNWNEYSEQSSEEDWDDEEDGDK